jgi:hypothetical protein
MRLPPHTQTQEGDTVNPIETYLYGRCPHCGAGMMPSLPRLYGGEERRCTPCLLTWTYSTKHRLLTVWAGKRNATHMTWEALTDTTIEVARSTVRSAVRTAREHRMRALMIK